MDKGEVGGGPRRGGGNKTTELDFQQEGLQNAAAGSAEISMGRPREATYQDTSR